MQYSLKQQADTAFGWDEELELEFKQAQQDFPFTYPEPTIPVVAVATPATAPILQIWPNPASHALNITLPKETTQYTISLYSLNGTRVLNKVVQGNITALNISTLPDGVYVVTVADGKKVVARQKVVVSNVSLNK